MTIKTTVLALALGAFAFALPQQGRADTGISYHCHCKPADGATCSCKYSYTLGAFATKEFRGYCDEVSNPVYPDVLVNKRDSSTCTIQVGTPIAGYTTKSCTNWNAFNSDTLEVQVKCSKD